MSIKKLTDKLAEHIENTAAGDMLEIIVELDPTRGKEILSGSEALSRQERIAKLQEDFTEQCAAVASKIADAGGEILGQAWINKTLKVRVPAGSIDQISDDDEVAVVDLPEKIEAESK
jgi:hypothetical protein